jgi:hypothetical protein
MSTDSRKDDSEAGLYLDLLKKVLTNTIYTVAGTGKRSDFRAGVH